MPTINIHNYKTRQEAIDLVSGLDLTKVHHVKVTCKRGKRSIDQNAYYWLILTCIMQESGQDKDSLHYYFRSQYLGMYERICFGSVITEPKSTTELDSKQFTQYIEEIRIFAATELGITIPNPEDLKYQQFIEHYSKFI